MESSSLEPPDHPPPFVLDYLKPDLVIERPMLPIAERIFHFLAAIVLPVVCFLMSAEHYPPGPEYQRGRWSDYLGLIPTARVGWSFYPLLAFAMYAAAVTIFQPRKAINRFHVRVGLLSGIVLAYQYAFIHVVSVWWGSEPMVMGWLVGLVLPPVFVAGMLFARWAASALIWQRQWYRTRGLLVFWLPIGVLAAAGAVVMPRYAAGSVGIVIFGTLFIAPGLTLATFVALFLLVLRRGERLDRPTWTYWPLPGGWLLLFAGAWARSYLNAVNAYAKLPPTNPNCYVATAAARGHRRVVGSRWLNGRYVNRQLAILKAGERAMVVSCPRIHRSIRSIYDVLGPVLARQMDDRLVADIAFLALKPAEWITAAVLAFAALRIRTLMVEQ